LETVRDQPRSGGDQGVREFSPGGSLTASLYCRSIPPCRGGREGRRGPVAAPCPHLRARRRKHRCQHGVKVGMEWNGKTALLSKFLTVGESRIVLPETLRTLPISPTSFRTLTRQSPTRPTHCGPAFPTGDPSSANPVLGIVTTASPGWTTTGAWRCSWCASVSPGPNRHRRTGRARPPGGVVSTSRPGRSAGLPREGDGLDAGPHPAQEGSPSGWSSPG
jgi:hypothetical protein